MKLLTFLAFAFLLPSPAFASWHYNENAGFGIYQPEGWSATIEGRSSRLGGPVTDTSQSEIFLGSDWVSPAVKDSDSLAAHMRNETGLGNLVPVTVSELPGFRAGTATDGSIYVLRVPGNVIVIDYNLRGSRGQLEEAETMLGSIEIRTRGYEN